MTNNNLGNLSVALANFVEEVVDERLAEVLKSLDPKSGIIELLRGVDRLSTENRNLNDKVSSLEEQMFALQNLVEGNLVKKSSMFRRLFNG